LDRDEALIEIVEREAGEKRVRGEAICMGHAPRRVAKMAVHRREDGVNFRFGLGRHLVGVVRFPHVGMRGIGDDAAMRRCDDLVAKPSLPPIGLGQEARQVVCHRTAILARRGPSAKPRDLALRFPRGRGRLHPGGEIPLGTFRQGAFSCEPALRPWQTFSRLVEPRLGDRGKEATTAC
jgi:hypothetical protein